MKRISGIFTGGSGTQKDWGRKKKGEKKKA